MCERLFWHIGAYFKHVLPLGGDEPLSDEDLRYMSPDYIRRTGRRALAVTAVSALALTGGIIVAATTDANPNPCNPEAVGTADQCS